MAEHKNPSEKSKNPGKKTGNGSERGALTHAPSRFLSGPSFGPVGRLRNEFDRLFDQFFQGWPAWNEQEFDRGWGVDVQESDKELVVRADAPGFEPGDFNVEVRGDQLVLCACQSEESEEGDQGYHWQKREFHRSLPLPAGIDADHIDAEYRNGVLTLTLPKTEEAKGRKIQIKG